MSNSEKKSIRRWEVPFRTEQDVSDQFSRNADELIELLETHGLDAPRELEQLRFAKSKYETWAGATSKPFTNMFLVPAVQAAHSVAEILLKHGHFGEAFWTANMFGEMSKILSARNRGKYEELFDDLLL